jgi:hypothetical protein
MIRTDLDGSFNQIRIVFWAGGDGVPRKIVAPGIFRPNRSMIKAGTSGSR